jgi:hypothetical protein
MTTTGYTGFGFTISWECGACGTTGGLQGDDDTGDILETIDHTCDVDDGTAVTGFAYTISWECGACGNTGEIQGDDDTGVVMETVDHRCDVDNDAPDDE